MKNQNGNALFLILIATALFAALYYAVTNSGRGGSGVDKEQAELGASQIMQIISSMQSIHTREKIIGGVDQVHLSTNSENSSGTCYTGATTSTCTNVGYYNA